MRALGQTSGAEITIQVDPAEMGELARPESLVSRMAGQNPGAYQEAWSLDAANAPRLHLTVDEAVRMASQPRMLPVDHALFNIVTVVLRQRGAR